jgi:PTH1 family peptidyl-tRNA hydrolase
VPLVLGLGNPGPRYVHTRHNVGETVVERLVARFGAVPLETVPEYRAWRAVEGERELDLMVPLTFMNASGVALEAWRSRWPFAAEELLVVVDDVYLPLGRLRLRGAGSSGGHRGLESIESAMGGREWARLRIGVGSAESAAELRDHVLETFEPEELKTIDEALDRAADAVVLWAQQGLTQAMNRYNRAEKEVSEP